MDFAFEGDDADLLFSFDLVQSQSIDGPDAADNMPIASEMAYHALDGKDWPEPEAIVNPGNGNKRRTTTKFPTVVDERASKRYRSGALSSKQTRGGAPKDPERNQREKNRQHRLRAKFEELRTMLDPSSENPPRMTKSNILHAAMETIHSLRRRLAKADPAAKAAPTTDPRDAAVPPLSLGHDLLLPRSVPSPRGELAELSQPPAFSLIARRAPSLGVLTAALTNPASRARAWPDIADFFRMRRLGLPELKCLEQIRIFSGRQGPLRALEAVMKRLRRKGARSSDSVANQVLRTAGMSALTASVLVSGRLGSGGTDGFPVPSDARERCRRRVVAAAASQEDSEAVRAHAFAAAREEVPAPNAAELRFLDALLRRRSAVQKLERALRGRTEALIRSERADACSPRGPS
jgi:hypothetical protein